MAWKFVLPQNLCVEAFNSQSEDIGRWGLWEVISFIWDHENGAPMMELAFL